MISLKSTHIWPLALLLLISIPFVTASAQDNDRDKDKDSPRELKTFFKVAVRQGPSAGLVAYGLLTLNVNPRTGNFTGTLTPAVTPDTGTQLSTVLFTQRGDSLVPSPSAVASVDLRGTLNGHAINLIAPEAGGPGKALAGVGTMENTLQEWLQSGTQGFIGGPAIGPEPGDSGDWLTLCCPFPRPVFDVHAVTLNVPFSSAIVNVDSYSLDLTNHNLSVTISEAANPNSFGTFRQGAYAAQFAEINGTGHPFGGTLIDSTLQQSVVISRVTDGFGSMFIASLNLSASGPATIQIMFHYQSLTTTTTP